MDDAIDHSPHGYISNKDNYLTRLRRIEGQARGIARMIDEEQYCIDILTQISALTSALQGVALDVSMITSNIAWSTPCRPATTPATKIAEASKAIARLVRS